MIAVVLKFTSANYSPEGGVKVNNAKLFLMVNAVV